MPNQFYQRAQLLYRQRRYAQAAQELRTGIPESGADADSYALLALCLANMGELEEAAAEARRAVVDSPNSPFSHYAMSWVYFKSNKLQDAELSATEAIRLSPMNPDYLALLANIQLRCDRPRECLETTGKCLSVVPDHAAASNLSAMALIKLGRKDEAAAVVSGTLNAHPDNALTHANQGWTRLHQGNYRAALESFREALRLDPDLDWARQGMLTALKARYPMYRWMLAYFLFMGRMSGRARWATTIGLIVVMQIFNIAGQLSPSLRAPAMLLIAAYGVFIFFSWTVNPFSNLLMQASPYGRYLLNSDQRESSSVAGIMLGAAAAVAVTAILMRSKALGYLALGLLLLLIPACALFHLPKGRQRITAGIFVIAVVGMLIREVEVPDAGAIIQISLVSVIASTWVFRLLQHKNRQKR